MRAQGLTIDQPKVVEQQSRRWVRPVDNAYMERLKQYTYLSQLK